MSVSPHPPTIQQPPPAPVPRRARRIVGGCAFCAAVVGGTMAARTLALLTTGDGVPGFDLAVGWFVFGMFLAGSGFLGYLGATDLLPLFPRREEGSFARWSAIAGLASGALAAALSTIGEGILGDNGTGSLVALAASLVLGWVATQTLLGRAIRMESLHPLARSGRCTKCGYDLRATRAGRCPECGARVR